MRYLSYGKRCSSFSIACSEIAECVIAHRVVWHREVIEFLPNGIHVDADCLFDNRFFLLFYCGRIFDKTAPETGNKQKCDSGGS
jgi:hypothetical protein